MADKSSSGADKASGSRSSAESSAGPVIRAAGTNVVSGREARYFHHRFKVLTGENKVLRDRLKTSHDRLKRLQALKARLISRAGVLAAESERLQDIKSSLQQVFDLQARDMSPATVEGCND